MGWFSDSWLGRKVKSAGNAIADGASAVGKGIARAGRLAAVAGQGVVQGVAGGVASVADLAVNVGYNWTTRNAINLFREENLESKNFNLAGRAAEAVTIAALEPKDDTERLFNVGGRIVGEVVAVATATVATAGLGGALVGGVAGAAATTGLTAARATVIGARAMQVGTRAAGATAKFLNPLTKSGAVIEGSFGAVRGYQLFTEDKEAQERADGIKGDMAADMLNEALSEQQILKNSLNRVSQEIGTIMEELQAGEASPARTQELLERLDQLEEHNHIIENLRDEDLTPETRELLWERLKAIDPQVAEELEAAHSNQGINSDYSRDANSGNLGPSFDNAGNGAGYDDSDQPETGTPENSPGVLIPDRG